MSAHAANYDAPPMCNADEEVSGARCHKGPGHAGPHNGWAHYPGQLVSWESRVIPSESGQA